MANTNLVYPYEFEGGKKAVASEVNANFEAIKAFSNGVNTTFTELRAALDDLKNKPTREMFDIYYSFSAETPVGAYPLWTGETIVNCKTLYPQFWKKLNSLAEKSKVPTVTSAQYEEKLKTYGQCASFYIDTLNGNVRLPKITRFISSIADLTQLANVENDTLKKHKHNVKVSSSKSKAGYDESQGYLARGYTKYSSPWSETSTGTNSLLITETGETEAHPKNVRLCLYIQVANNVGEISELDVDVIINQMNNALEEIENAYNTYCKGLTDLYEQIKDDIIQSSPTVKEEDIIVTPDMFYTDTTYEDYPFAVDIDVDDATESGIPTVNLALEQTQSGNFAPVSYAGNGYVRIYAKSVPDTEFVIPSIVVQ